MVGLVGILLPISRAFFFQMTPYMLLYSFLLVFLEEGRWVQRSFIALILTLICSFSVEYIGVNYGYLFGDYNYGSLLGYKYLNVPVIIPFMWVMLSIASRSLTNLITRNYLLSAFLSAIIVTAYDFLLEQVAVRFGWWWWQDGEIPLFNFACWFVFSCLFQLFFRKVPSNTGRSFWIIFVHLAFYWILLMM